MSSRTSDLRRLAQPAAGAMLGGGCAAYLYPTSPARHQVFIPCPFHAATGLYCPACGGLRMVHDLLHGQFSAAAHDNGLAIAGVAIGCIAWGNWTIRRWRGQQPPARPAWLSPANIAVMIVWTIVRNLPALGALRPLS